ncbi:MAG: hypothetical protein JWP34_5429 [Massilia sp.]|nr:hypothetical protein [Massilia sp.]
MGDVYESPWSQSPVDGEYSIDMAACVCSRHGQFHPRTCAQVLRGGPEIYRLISCGFERLINTRVNGAKLPRLKIARDKRLLQLDQIQRMGKIEQLLENKITQATAGTVGFVEHQISYAARVVGWRSHIWPLAYVRRECGAA